MIILTMAAKNDNTHDKINVHLAESVMTDK